MADGSAIEWTGATWNFVTGCSRISDGCTRCYIERTPPFRMAGRRFDGPQIGATTGVLLHPERLDWPLRWRTPRRIFVNSLSDLFHEAVPDGLIAEAFAVMLLAPRHTFQVLTKRPGRMRSLLRSEGFRLAAQAEACALTTLDYTPDEYADQWPLPNVWLGVSVEDQRWADIRVPELLETPAAMRWISAEPLLGPVDLSPWLYGPPACGCGIAPDGAPGTLQGCSAGCMVPSPSALDWVIVGGESGPHARPMHPNWARSLRDQCQAAKVAFFFKQWGSHRWIAHSAWDEESGDWVDRGVEAQRVGKHVAGRVLDGRTWDEYPQVVHT